MEACDGEGRVGFVGTLSQCLLKVTLCSAPWGLFPVLQMLTPKQRSSDIHT